MWGDPLTVWHWWCYSCVLASIQVRPIQFHVAPCCTVYLTRCVAVPSAPQRLDVLSVWGLLLTNYKTAAVRFLKGLVLKACWKPVRQLRRCQRADWLLEGGEATLQVARQSAAMMETKEGGLTTRTPIFNCHPRNQSFKTSSLLENSRRTHSKQYFSARKGQTHAGKHVDFHIQRRVSKNIHAHSMISYSRLHNDRGIKHVRRWFLSQIVQKSGASHCERANPIFEDIAFLFLGT